MPWLNGSQCSEGMANENGRKVAIVRHGHREDFVGERESPDWAQTAPRPRDPDISSRGIAEARSLASTLKGGSIRHVFSSPFLRAVHTAAYTAEALGLDVEIEDGIHEWMHPMNFEAFPELLSLEELQRRFGHVSLGYEPRGDRNYPEPTLEAVGRRTTETLEKLLADFEGDFVMFTHADPLVALLRTLGFERIALPVRTCAVYEIVQSNQGWRLTRNGTTDHLV